MRITACVLVSICLCTLVQNASATTWYVATNGNDSAAGTNWITAKMTIQAGVDAASAGETVWVTNGLYNTGGRSGFPKGSALTNRVAINKAITVRSVNGPQATRIAGQPDPALTYGRAAVRCVYLTNGAALIGFTLTNGYTGTGNFTNLGGGAWCQSSAAVLSNCMLTGNSADFGGGGAYRGTVLNSVLSHNSAGAGGGAYDAVLVACTVSNNSADSWGGGIYQGFLTNCLLIGNSAVNFFGGGAQFGTLDRCILAYNSAPAYGGGANNATLNNCVLYGNSAGDDGGGAYEGTLKNCTLAGNVADTGGGAYSSRMANCISCFNSASPGPNFYGGFLTNCCTWPMPAGPGNFTNEPGLLGLDNPHIVSNSLCINAGSNQLCIGATDVDGEPRTNGANVDVGCDEYWAGGITGLLSTAISVSETWVVVGDPITFISAITGRASRFEWSFGDGGGATNRTVVEYSWSTTGRWPVVLTAWNNEGSASATVVVRVASAIAYVAPGGFHIPPFDNWWFAANDIRSAVDACPAGGLVLVSNGTYSTGGQSGYPTGSLLTNRVVLDKAIEVCSVNGPEFTSIVGQADPGGGHGPAAVRCVYVGEGAVLSGFTMRNGYTDVDGWGEAYWGGGAFVEKGVLSGCIVSGNYSFIAGGGVFCRGGRVSGCDVVENVCSNEYAGSVGSGAGIYCEQGAHVERCSIARNVAGANGGGLLLSGGDIIVPDECEADRCLVTENTANTGGGVYFDSGGYMQNTVLARNSAEEGGGLFFSYEGYAVNCTIYTNGANISGGGAFFYEGGSATGCVIYGNTAFGEESAGNYGVYGGSTSLDFCCTAPLPSGEGNISADPLFVDTAFGDLHLQSNSPCINAGQDQSWMPDATDIDGNPRVRRGRVDIGAYESDDWGRCSDVDEDQFTDWNEVYVIGSDPTNPASYLGMTQSSDAGIQPGVTGLLVHWQSVAGKYYRLERSTNLDVGFPSVLQTNIVAVPPMNTETDATAIGNGPWIYRIWLER